MILLTRLPEPAILAEKKDTWLQTYLKKRAKKPNKRPPSSQYGHREIRRTLESMSFYKCFYCEHKQIETKGEVDHYIEVTEEPALAFEWTNLYLSCPELNYRRLKQLQRLYEFLLKIKDRQLRDGRKTYPLQNVGTHPCGRPGGAGARPAPTLTYGEDTEKHSLTMKKRRLLTSKKLIMHSL